MKRLIAILAMLLLGPAMAQEVMPPTVGQMETGNIIYTTLNPPPQGAQFNWSGFINFNTGGGGLQGGDTPAYNSQTGTFVWGYGQGTVTYNFYGNSDWPTSGIQVDGFKYSWEYFNQDFSRGFLSGNISIFGNNNNLLETYNFAMPQTTEGWTILSGQIDFATAYDRTELGRLQLSFTGVDDRFWAGFWGPQVRDIDLSILYSEIVEPIAPDCTVNPSDPTCIIQDLTDFTNEELLVTTELDTGDDGSEPIIKEEEEKTYVANETTDMEKLLQDEDMSDNEMDNEEQTVVANNEPTIKEMANEEKAVALTDNISSNILELALSAAENAVSLATTETSSTTTATSSNSRTTSTAEATETKSEETKSEETQVADNGNDAAVELLDTGRTLNSQSLAITEAQSEQSISDSINQAENIAMSSGESRTTDSVIETIGIENVFANDNNSVSTGVDSEIVTEEKKTETVIEEVVADNIEQNVETSVDTMDSFADIMNIEIKPSDTSTDDVEFVQNVLAQLEQKSEDTNISAFEEDEKVTIQNDPNLSNAFNVVPNTTNLEILGVINNKQDEKSDAEKRAEQVVAANKEQQDEINKNYMDADQSGIVAAMSEGTDVNSYRSAMLNDNNIWYKPEDIYKNVVYKDNVRGSYYLEKGNSDTYKKMVEEQYK